MFRFSNSSKKKLMTCHLDLQKIMNKAIEISDIDFGIAEGHRSIERQKLYFKQGKSKIDGITKMSKHNYNPSLAVDLYGYFKDSIRWDDEPLSYMAGLIRGVTELLFERGEITHKIRWGGNWDMDGEILTDQSFDDRPHFELILPRKYLHSWK